MRAEVSQFRNSSGPFTPKELCENSSKADAIMKDTHIGRCKLSRIGVLILEEHLRLYPEDTHPASYTLNALLQQVRSAQISQNISYNAISRWFQRRRLKLQKQAPQQSAASLTSPTMPFNEDILRKLQILVDAIPNPSPDVLDTWASLFHVPKEMLHYAIHVILPEKASEDAHQLQTDGEQQDALHRLNAGLPLQHLPTPANSLTPEPAPAANNEAGEGSPEFMKNECNTPTLVCSTATGSERGMVAQPRHHSTTESIPAPVLDQAAYSQFSPPPIPIVPAAQVNSQASETVDIPFMTHIIFSGIVEACSDVAQNSHEGIILPPKTAAEFEALFAPYKTTLETLSRMLDTTFENTPADRPSTSRKSF